MKDNEFKRAFERLTPSDELGGRINELVSMVELKEERVAEKTERRMVIGRKIKAPLIIAAAVTLFVVSAAAYGVASGTFARLFYMPGVGLVDGDGVPVTDGSVVGETSIYTMEDEIDFGDYAIIGVTATDNSGNVSYVIQTTYDAIRKLYEAEPNAMKRNGKVRKIADHTLGDLTVTTSNGTVLSDYTVSYNMKGGINYYFEADNLDTALIIGSETVGARIDITLSPSDTAPKITEFPTANGITAIYYPVDEDMDEFYFEYSGEIKTPVDDIGGELASVFPGVKATEKNGKRSTGGAIGVGTFSDGTRYSVRISDGGPFEITDVTIFGLSTQYNIDKFVTVPMPADGERIDQKIVLIDEAGLKLEIEGYARSGDKMKVYIREPNRCGTTVYFEENYEEYFIYAPMSFKSEDGDRWDCAAMAADTNTITGLVEITYTFKYEHYTDGTPSTPWSSDILDQAESFQIGIDDIWCDYYPEEHWHIDFE